jgi:hypothetical protein
MPIVDGSGGNSSTSFFTPDLAVTGIGSLPHLSAAEALADVLALCPEYPYWPQLPRLSPQEDMYRQFSAGLPGLILSGLSPFDRVTFRHDADALGRLQRVYEDVLAGERSLGNWAVPLTDAAGLYALAEALSEPGSSSDPAESSRPKPAGVKGGITGPISLGLAVTDEEGRPLLYDEDLMDGVVRALALRARWQEDFLAGAISRGRGKTGPAPVTLISVDEPYLGTFGSAYFPYQPETVLSYLEIFAASLRGLWGLHCCANTDWEFLLASPARFLSFDAYSYGDRLALYPEGLKRFLGRGNLVLWGIAPTDAEALATEDGPGLARRLLGCFEALVARGVPEEALRRQSMITPACGLAGLSVDQARRVMELTRTAAAVLRESFPG